MIKQIQYCVIAIILIFISAQNNNAQINFDFQSIFKYLKGSEASALPGDWYQPGFNDTSWSSGTAPFWYGDGAAGTQLTDMRDNYSTFYLRNEFAAENIDQLKDIEFYIDYDDGFIIWINGMEVLRQNVPDNVTNSSFALNNHESGVAELFVLDSSGVSLNEGINSIAIQVLNVTLSSSDIHFDISIISKPQLPELDPAIGEVRFSHEAGFYSESFQLTLTSPDTISGIIYTLDGSNPKTSGTSYAGESPVTVNIDPSRTDGRPQTPAVIVRASLFREGFAPSVSRTRTYLFIDRVKDQSYPGAPWPDYNVNGQIIDLDMDPDVVNDPRYSSQIDDALLDIPTMSIVTDNRNLFDPSYGIYVNARGYGDEWERDCSLELLDPNGRGFQVNAGVRIRGGASRDGVNPKHAFRLFFREEYGDPKLEFPLFGMDGTDSFDKIDIRTEQNYSWSKDGSPAAELNTFIKDIYSRKLQGLMGQPYSRSRYYHLYLNGIYWGLFMTEERPEARFAESYFGDDREDYDVVKVTTQSWPYYNIVTDGNMDAWEEIWNMCQVGFSTNENYFKLEGKNAAGDPVIGSKVLVDIDNLIDYMAMTFYTGNFDGPVSAWYGEDMPNNYFGIYNRKNRGTGFVFIAHDQEHSMMIDPIYVGDGLYENRVTIPGMSVSGLLSFQPQWLHYKLTSNPEYRLRFADRTYKYFHNSGLFTPETAKHLFNEFKDQIDKAIIAESARWGDSKSVTPRTRDDDWIPAIEDLNNRFFPGRTEIVINQMKDARFLTENDPPRFLKDQIPIVEEIVYFSGNLSILIENPNEAGELCYTTDGSDPRQIGGETAPSAISSSADVSMQMSGTTIIYARIRSGNSWSSISKLVAVSDVEDYANLKVTELHYHPPDIISNGDTISGKDMEFIEFKNTGDLSINLSGMILDSAVLYLFPEASFLPPGSFYVIASKPECFYDIYGRNPSGNYSKNFGNAGEYVLLTDSSGNEILSFTYSDTPPWPDLADGAGYSLVSMEYNPVGDPSDYSYWRASYNQGGSPFSDDLVTSDEKISGDEFSFKLYPNPATSYFTVQCDNDEQSDLVIYDSAGNIIFNGRFVNHITLNTADIGGSGLYFIKLMNRDKISIRKFIIL